MDAGLDISAAEALRALLPNLVNTWSQTASKSAQASASSSSSASTTATLPDFALVESALKPSIDSFASQNGRAFSAEAGSKDAIALELRTYLTDRLVDELDSSSTEHVLSLIYACCDVALLLAAAGVTDVPAAFALIEETIDYLPVEACASLWSYAEIRRPLLTQGFVPSKGAALAILRTSNELLRRITKSDTADANLGGRVLGYVSEVFPLDDKAGRNSQGAYNAANVTTLEPPRKRKAAANEDADGADQEGAGEGGRVDDEEEDDEDDDSQNGLFPPRFYEDFWALQRFFSSPRSLAEPYTSPTSAEGKDAAQEEKGVRLPPAGPNSLQHFYKLTRTVLDVFKKIQDKETERAYAKSSVQGKDADNLLSEDMAETAAASAVATQALPSFPFLQPLPTPLSPRKRKREEEGGDKGKRARRADAMEVDEQASARPREDEDDQLFFPKFLTNRKLLKYELQDPSFRFHILLQYFVLLQYVLSWYGGDEKWGKDKVKVAALQRPLSLSNEDNNYLRRHLWPQISQLARSLQPHLSVEPAGPTFVSASSLKHAQTPTLLALDTKTTQAIRGPEFLRTANQILRREQHWVHWKMNGCEPPIERSWVKNGDVASNQAEERKVLADARNKLAAAQSKGWGPPGGWEHALGTAALTRLWERGFPPPVEGTRLRENDDGIEELVKTDGLEMLEGFRRDVPTVAELADRVMDAERRVTERKAELRTELLERKRAKAKEEREERRRKEQQEDAPKPEEGEAGDEQEDVEMKDAEAGSESKPNADTKTTTEASAESSSKAKPEPDAEIETEIKLSNEELTSALPSDEDYAYLDEARLHASWKYLRLARTSTILHWKSRGPNDVAGVIEAVSQAVVSVGGDADPADANGVGNGTAAATSDQRTGEDTGVKAAVAADAKAEGSESAVKPEAGDGGRPSSEAPSISALVATDGVKEDPASATAATATAAAAATSEVEVAGDAVMKLAAPGENADVQGSQDNWISSATEQGEL